MKMLLPRPASNPLPSDLEELYLRVLFRYQDDGPQIVHVDVLEPSAARIMAAAAVDPDDEALYGAIGTQLTLARKN
jgi:hypothetical protein